jgi:phosphohistidine phosphatase
LKLYFLRHGIAEDHSPTGRDADRRLTPEGITEMEAAAKGMAGLDLRLDVVLTSPKERARHTAEIAAAAMGISNRLRREPLLADSCGLDELRRALAGEAPSARVLLVGHQPDLSLNIGALIGGGRVQMKKASLAYLEVSRIEPGGAELRWLLHAAQLGRIGAGGDS